MKKITKRLVILDSLPARACIFVCTGDGKKDIVEGIFDHGEDFPAGRVRPTEGELIWVLDSAAAATCKRAA